MTSSFAAGAAVDVAVGVVVDASIQAENLESCHVRL